MISCFSPWVFKSITVIFSDAPSVLTLFYGIPFILASVSSLLLAPNHCVRFSHYVIILPRFTQEWTIHPRLCSCHPSRALTNGSWPLLKPSPYPAWRLAGHLYIVLFQGFSYMVSSLDVLRALWLKAVWLLMWWLKASTVIIPGSKVEGVGRPG